jgi:DNA-directed RNA polymerase subunit RPC12/RpoP
MFVAIRSYDTYIPANLVLQRLEAEGIRAYLQDEHTVTIDPILTNAVGGIKLMVTEQQAPRALDLLVQWEKEYQQAVACPQCGSSNVHHVTQTSNPANWFSAIATWLFGNYAVAVKKVYRCFDCGNEFEELES